MQLIQDGKAYVCDLDAEAMREYRGSLTEPGKESLYRKRSIDENLTLFEQMKAGAFADGGAHPTSQNRHGLAEHQSARPSDVPH